MPRVSREHKAARRVQIIEAAMVCLARDGPNRTTMTGVIKESGLSAGAVYLYFQDKDKIIGAMIEHVLLLLTQWVEEMFAQDDLPTVADVIRHLADRVEDQTELSGVDVCKVLVVTWAESVVQKRRVAMAGQHVSSIRDRAAELVRAAQAAGRWDPAADPQAVALAVVGLFPGFLLQRALSPAVVDAETYAEAVAALLGGQREGLTG